MVMPVTKTQRGAAATARPARPKKSAPRSTNGARKHSPKVTADRTTVLSKEVLESMESGQREAIDAVRKFMDSVDKALPLHGEGPSRRQEVVDSALGLADRLVHTQYDFLRKVVKSAGESLNKADGEK
jgi:hypothetical protein